MLILGLKEKERVRITVGDVEFYIKVTEMRRGIARLGFEAPKSVKIVREELLRDSKK